MYLKYEFYSKRNPLPALEIALTIFQSIYLTKLNCVVCITDCKRKSAAIRDALINYIINQIARVDKRVVLAYAVPTNHFIDLAVRERYKGGDIS